jgi:hypothetical protein
VVNLAEIDNLDLNLEVRMTYAIPDRRLKTHLDNLRKPPTHGRIIRQEAEFLERIFLGGILKGLTKVSATAEIGTVGDGKPGKVPLRVTVRSKYTLDRSMVDEAIGRIEGQGLTPTISRLLQYERECTESSVEDALGFKPKVRVETC